MAQNTKLRPVVWTRFLPIGLLATGLLVSISLAAGDGTHARTATMLLDAYKKLRSDNSLLEQAGEDQVESPERMLATFGTGCFWCTEAVFEQIEGVTRVESGYSGGFLANPTYQQVLTKTTGHAEVVHVEYDPTVVSFAKLLEVFWFSHDPTTLNRQGVDKGPQYRSAIFYHTERQKELAELYKRKLDDSKAFRNPIVTEITRFSVFYPAENYHQDYFALNGRMPYCRQNIRPKVRKLRKVFADDVKASR